MARILTGGYSGEGRTFGIVVSRFNEFITQKLLEGCLDGLERHGVAKDAITVAWVPGALEIPIVAGRLAGSGSYDGVICLGAVIRGATGHYDLVVQGAARGIADVGTQTGVPTVFGVLTCDTIEQALERAGTKSGNKGFDAALTALEMANLLSDLG